MILIGIPILALCLFWLPWITKEAEGHFPAYLLYPAAAGLYLSAIPFYTALYQAFRLLSCIDKSKAFSDFSVRVGLVIPFASLVIAVFAAVLEKLLQNALDIQSENDLTI